MYVCMYVCMYVYMHVCLSVCLCVSLSNEQIHEKQFYGCSNSVFIVMNVSFRRTKLKKEQIFYGKPLFVKIRKSGHTVH